MTDQRLTPEQEQEIRALVSTHERLGSSPLTLAHRCALLAEIDALRTDLSFLQLAKHQNCTLECESLRDEIDALRAERDTLKAENESLRRAPRQSSEWKCRIFTPGLSEKCRNCGRPPREHPPQARWR